MKKGKIIFIDRNISNEKEIESIVGGFLKKDEIVELASESDEKFYTIPEATMILLKRGVKQVSAISLSLPQIEVPIYWSTY